MKSHVRSHGTRRGRYARYAWIAFALPFALGFVSLAEARQLDATWALKVNGQAVQVEPDGSFRIPNIAALDMLPQATPGGMACCDGLSDDYLRVTGVSLAQGMFAHSAPFRITIGEAFSIGGFTFGTLPPPFPEFIALSVSPQLLTIQGAQAMSTVIGTLFDGTTVDVSSAADFTTYRTSNPLVATVDENGVITAEAPGMAFITAVNEGASAVAQVDVSFGDPLTQVVGFAFIEATGAPAFPGTVEVLGVSGATGVTSMDGSFSISMVPTVLGDLTVRVDAMDGITLVAGLSDPTAPVPGLLTDVGIIALSPFIPLTITFDAGFGAPLSYTEAGLTVTSLQGHLHMGDNDGDGSPDLYNHSGCCSTPVLFGMGGNPFNVISMEVKLLTGGTHTFTASSGAMTGVTGTGLFVFPVGWQGITSFTWEAVSAMVIDNLVLEATP